MYLWKGGKIIHLYKVYYKYLLLRILWSFLSKCLVSYCSRAALEAMPLTPLEINALPTAPATAPTADKSSSSCSVPASFFSLANSGLSSFTL